MNLDSNGSKCEVPRSCMKKQSEQSGSRVSKGEGGREAVGAEGCTRSRGPRSHWQELQLLFCGQKALEGLEQDSDRI